MNFFSGLTLTNNDYIFGRVDSVTVDMTSACNEAEPYATQKFIVLVKDGMVKQALCPNLITEIICHSGSFVCCLNGLVYIDIEQHNDHMCMNEFDFNIYGKNLFRINIATKLVMKGRYS